MRSEALHNPRTSRKRVLEREPRIALTPLAVWQPDPAADDPQVRQPARTVEARRGQERLEEGEPQRRFDGRGTQVALDPLQDLGQPDELPIGVQAQDLVDQSPGRRARETGRAARATLADRTSTSAARARSASSTGAWLLPPPELIATHGAPVVLQDGMAAGPATRAVAFMIRR